MDGSTKIVKTYKDPTHYSPSGRGLVHRQDRKKSIEIKFKKGEILKGLVLKTISSKISQIALPGGTVTAEIHNRLEVGDELFFIVDSISPELRLKVYSILCKHQHEKRSIDELIRILDLPDMNIYYDLLENLVQYRNEIKRAEVLEIIGILNTYNENEIYKIFPAFIQSTLTIIFNDISHNKIEDFYSFFGFPQYFQENHSDILQNMTKTPNLKKELSSLLYIINSYQAEYNCNIKHSKLYKDKMLNQNIHCIFNINSSRKFGKDYYIILPIIYKSECYLAKLIIEDLTQAHSNEKKPQLTHIIDELENAFFINNENQDITITKEITNLAIAMKKHLIRNRLDLKYFIINDDNNKDLNLLDGFIDSKLKTISIVV